MNAFGIRISSALVGLALVTAATGGALSVHSSGAENAKLEHLLNEKLSTLQKITEQMEQLYALREIGHKDVYDARIAMYRAQIDLCTTDEAKLTILRRILAEAKQREEALRGMPKAATRGVSEDVLALLDRLDIEIEIERFVRK